MPANPKKPRTSEFGLEANERRAKIATKEVYANVPPVSRGATTPATRSAQTDRDIIKDKEDVEDLAEVGVVRGTGALGDAVTKNDRKRRVK